MYPWEESLGLTPVLCFLWMELSECTELRLSERLRVYLECLLMEKQELEGRAFVAERTVVELEHTGRRNWRLIFPKNSESKATTSSKNLCCKSSHFDLKAKSATVRMVLNLKMLKCLFQREVIYLFFKDMAN